MKKNTLLMIVGVILIALAIVLWARPRPENTDAQRRASRTTEGNPDKNSSASMRIPAHYETAPALNSLAPTLPPDQLTGKTREAYRAVREIPQTIAQLPCYCYCDEGHGHKSLHSCFEDNHAASCAVCVQEALLAYKLEKEQGLTASQIRERIVSTQGSANH